MDQSLLIGLIIFATIASVFALKQNMIFVIWAGVLGILLLPGYLNVIGGPILELEDALNVLLNEGLLTIIALLVVASGLKRTGAIGFLLDRVLSITDSKFTLRAKLISSTAILSGFFNNTPLVAALVPYINQFSYEHNFNKSQLIFSDLETLLNFL